MILSELMTFLQRVDARPKKSLSQNFLIEPSITDKIVETAAISPNDPVLEIGPGPGGLTRKLLAAGARVYAVEMDTLFAKELTRFQNGKLTIFEADILKFAIEQLPRNLKVVANLPYHITAPILEKLFSSSFSSITIMVQKEVADRMMAKPSTKDFGSLSLFVQFYSNCTTSFIVPPSAFYPRPTVDSTVIRLEARTAPDVDPKVFFGFVHKAFQQRRKMITSSLGLPKPEVRQALADIGMREDARPEMLSLEQWVELAKKLQQLLLPL